MLGGVDIVLSPYEVCCYGLVVSLTAISLCEQRQRKPRLRLFSQALDEFEAGAFDAALRCAKAAAGPDVAAAMRKAEQDYGSLRARLHRTLAQRPGSA